MRIFHVALHFAEYAVALSEALSLEHRVTTVLSRRNADAELLSMPRCPPLAGVRLMEDHRLYDPRLLLSAASLARALLEVDPDIVHCQEVPTDYLMAAWPVLARYPLVLTVHDPRHHGGAVLRRRIEAYRRTLRQRADAVIVHGEQLKQELERAWPRMLGRVLSVPHGPIGQGVHAEAAGRPDWVPGHLLFFGRVEAYKGLGVLLDAMEVLRSANAPVRLTVAGAGSDLGRHMERLHRLGVEVIDRFVSAGEVESLFRSANVVVLPYLDATGSGVAAMALRYGRPVVGTRTGAIPELVHDGVNGTLVPPGDAAGLALALGALLADPPRAIAYARAAASLAAGPLAWSVIARRTEAAYDVALAHHCRQR